jgi:hypothetical protein
LTTAAAAIGGGPLGVFGALSVPWGDAVAATIKPNANTVMETRLEDTAARLPKSD